MQQFVTNLLAQWNALPTSWKVAILLAVACVCLTLAYTPLWGLLAPILRKPWNGFLNRWDHIPIGWQQTIFGSAAAALIAVITLGGWWAFAALCAILLLLWLWVANGAKGHAEIQYPPYGDLRKRLGSHMSTYVDPIYVDDLHHYELIERVDYIDYGGNGDYRSVRRIRVRNDSKESTTHIVYVEHSERKVLYSDCNVRAFNTETKDELRTESFHDSQRTKSFSVAFRMFFPSPLKPGERFDLVYIITLPNELDDLNYEDECMSISLGRITKGVSKLIFKVVLNFKPASVFGNCQNRKNEATVLDANVSAPQPYLPTTWYELEYFGQWSSNDRFCIVMESNSPRHLLYKIHYKK